MLEKQQLINLLEALLLAANKPLTEKQILAIFDDHEKPSLSELRQALYELQNATEDRAIELVQQASGYVYQTKCQYSPWIHRLWQEKPPKYSRALLETLAIIAYRQPITRGEIEEIRGVSISSSIFRTLLEERSWIKSVGHRDVPGRPSLYATTKTFLDYFNLNSLEQLPPLAEIVQMFDKTEESKQQGQLELDTEAENITTGQNAQLLQNDEVEEDDDDQENAIFNSTADELTNNLETDVAEDTLDELPDEEAMGYEEEEEEEELEYDED